MAEISEATLRHARAGEFLTASLGWPCSTFLFLLLLVFDTWRDGIKLCDPEPIGDKIKIYTSYILHITYYILPIDCLSIAYRLPLMPICSAIMDMGPGPGPRAQKLLGRDLGDRSFWALGPGPGPISIMAEHMGIKDNR